MLPVNAPPTSLHFAPVHLWSFALPPLAAVPTYIVPSGACTARRARRTGHYSSPTIRSHPSMRAYDDDGERSERERHIACVDRLELGGRAPSAQ